MSKTKYNVWHVYDQVLDWFGLAFIAAAEKLTFDTPLRFSCARNACAYAGAHLDIADIGDRFEKIISR